MRSAKPSRSAAQLETVEAGVAADVEHAPAAQVLRDVRRDLAPLEHREIAERMLGRSLHALRQMQVMEPRPELRNLPLQRRRARSHRGHQ